MAFATFLVWRLRTGACGFWRYRMSPDWLGAFCPASLSISLRLVFRKKLEHRWKTTPFKSTMLGKWFRMNKSAVFLRGSGPVSMSNGVVRKVRCGGARRCEGKLTRTNEPLNMTSFQRAGRSLIVSLVALSRRSTHDEHSFTEKKVLFYQQSHLLK